MPAPSSQPRAACVVPDARRAFQPAPGWSPADFTRTLLKRWQAGLTCASETRFALAISLVWTLAYNLPFWHQTLATMGNAVPAAIAFLASLFVLVVCVQALLLLLMPTRMLMRLAASVLFVVAALGSYFCSAYGAIMSKDMLRNALETDPAEVGGLLSADLVVSLLVLGLLPALIVWKVSLPRITWTRRFRQRAGFLAGAIMVSGTGLFACSASYATFFREHKPIRFTLVPAAPVSSFAGLLGSRGAASGHGLVNPAGASVRVAAAQARPLVMFIVVGETVRAQNFQLGGYPRATTPRLQRIGGVTYLGSASSCGTSTAHSLPCMFSHVGREGFEVDEARQYTNVLDALARAGFDVEWRDNNSGCKGVCARVRQIGYKGHSDPLLCPNSYCYDEVMLTDLPARLRRVKQDTVIVFHQVGSHGPAYFERYPPAFERFRPACRSKELQECSRQEIVNAYDNTIAYTDHVLARLISMLQEASDSVDGMLIYASDHGESLGEQGLYLHGMPYAFAPRTQKEVPMLLWLSEAYHARSGVHAGCIRPSSGGQPSHDNLYHTVLGAAGVTNRVYDRRLDLLSGCFWRQLPSNSVRA